MIAFLEQITALPTVVFTVLVVVALLYWAFVIVTGLGFDGGVEGLGEGGAEALEGIGGAAALLGWIGFGRAPLSVLLSVWSVSAWVASYLLASLARSYLDPGLAVSAGIGGLAVAVTAPVVHVVAGRLGPLFEGAPAERRDDLIGRTCVITTGTVDLGFGQARLDEGGDWRIIQVRAPSGRLRRGDRALVVAWDSTLDAFRAEPLDTGLARTAIQAGASTSPKEDR